MIFKKTPKLGPFVAWASNSYTFLEVSFRSFRRFHVTTMRRWHDQLLSFFFFPAVFAVFFQTVASKIFAVFFKFCFEWCSNAWILLFFVSENFWTVTPFWNFLPFVSQEFVALKVCNENSNLNWQVKMASSSWTAHTILKEKSNQFSSSLSRSFSWFFW
jgi:hypothetical protein